MVVWEDEEEPRMAAILSEMSLPGPERDAAAAGVRLAAAVAAWLRSVAALAALAIRAPELAAVAGTDVEAEDAGRAAVAVLPGRLPPK